MDDDRASRARLASGDMSVPKRPPRESPRLSSISSDSPPTALPDPSAVALLSPPPNTPKKSLDAMGAQESNFSNPPRKKKSFTQMLFYSSCMLPTNPESRTENLNKTAQNTASSLFPHQPVLFCAQTGPNHTPSLQSLPPNQPAMNPRGKSRTKQTSTKRNRMADLLHDQWDSTTKASEADKKRRRKRRRRSKRASNQSIIQISAAWARDAIGGRTVAAERRRRRGRRVRLISLLFRH
uniref:Uncharacterized protein n=1 Tax=Oryza brachyantha TaxID=4533 RepID=J3LPU7_ORYBR